MKQRMEKIVSTLREKARRTGIVRKTIGLGLAIMMVLESPSWSGLIEWAFAHEDKVRGGRCIYVDTSLIGADSDVMESGIGAYVYNREGSSYSDAPIIMEEVEGKRNIYQLVLDDYYTYVEFTKGSDLNTGTKTGALAIDWSLGSPCYMFNSEALSDGGHFYGLYTVYFDLNGVPDASAFADNGVGVYAYNSDEDSYTAVPVAMKASGKGEGVYEYSFDRPYDCIAFMGGYGSWNYEVSTAPVYMEWSYSAPCFSLEQVDGYESTGVWRNLRYTVYFDASDIKDDEAFIENGVWLYAYNDSDDKLSENPVKMVASSVGSYIYEYTMERPYENLQFVLGDSLEAEVSSEVLYNDWMTYADPCYKMTLDRTEILMASPSPSMTPSASPSGSPSTTPGMDPSASPSGSPSATPSTSPSTTPSTSPSVTPGTTPSASPSGSPSAAPSITPTVEPTIEPTADPATTAAPTPTPAEIPEVDPTTEPITEPTADPTAEPTTEPTTEPITLGQARVAAELTVTYGAYEMVWVGTQDEVDIEPRIIEGVEPENTDDTAETPTTENQPDAEESDNSDTSADDTAIKGEGDEEEQSHAKSDASSNGKIVKTVSNIDTERTGYTDATTYTTSAPGFSRSNDNDKVTIYFDTSYNGSWDPAGNADGWNKEDHIFVHFYNNGTDKLPSGKLNPMEETDLKAREDGGVIWKYELTKEQAEIFTYAIFKRYNGTFENENQQTADECQIPYDMSRPCFILSNSNANGKKKTGSWYDLGPESQAGKSIYFYDMTAGNMSEVYAKFSREDSTEAEPDYVRAERSEDGYYEFVIPADALDPENVSGSGKPYSTISFYKKVESEEGEKYTQIGETYNFFNRASDGVKGFSYADGTMDTFYYGVTEKVGGTKISTWGAKASEEPVSLTGNKLFFDKLYFKVSKDTNADDEESEGTDTGDTSETKTSGARFQIGDEEPRDLTADSGDSRTYSYYFDGSIEADSQTILTYLDQDGTKYHFFWNEFDLKNADGSVVAGGNNLVTLEYEIARVMGKYVKGNTIYFDATFSKLSYYKSDGVQNDGKGIPASDTSPVYYLATGPGMPNLTDEMVKAEKESWKDVWKVDLPEGYTEIKFLAYANEPNPNVQNGYAEATRLMDIPSNLDSPCFYCDDGDSIIYDGGMRDGYWQEVYTVRDAEKYKPDRDVVDIRQGTFTRASDVFYVDSTFYDYYSDYELNGNNRDTYGGTNASNHRYWVPFRQFDQALSDFYEENSASVPIYTGHFQWPGWGADGHPFSHVSETLKLYGSDNENRFYSTNNSTINLGGNAGHYKDAAQGLVSDTLSGGSVVIKGGSALLPYFDKDFLSGNNSKNAVLGEVYENVAFPFTSEGINGIKYWTFDSKDTTLEMQQDSSTGQYYLENVGHQGWSRNVRSTGTLEGTTELSSEYGFFPFNGNSAETSGKNYNYGFGTKLEFKFRLTSDGTVQGADKKYYPIVFEFAGDDDVWVFIDGKLALDVGGAHGRVEGKLNFRDKTAWVSGTKTSAGSIDGGGAKSTPFEMVGANTSEHTLTMFYMERGMWESNMRITFNFPDENQLAVEKKVDVSGVNPAFQGLFQDASIFSFEIKNYATHYKEVDASAAANSVTKTFNSSGNFAGNIGKDSDKNTFASGASIEGRSNVVHWKALYDDPGRAYPDKRCGIIYPSTGKDTWMDLSDANRYLQFDVFYDNNGIPALNHMYIELVDNTGYKMSRTLNGVTYGSIDLERRVWTTITVDLDKFARGYSGFNWEKVQAVRFGYNYERDIYLDNFIFRSTSAPATLTGFVTKQYQIPSYYSIRDKGLVYPNGAQYTLTGADGSTSYGVIGDDGMFALADRESVLFRDQFRRGSYISLREITDEDVFDTSWTMYENGQEVKTMTGGDTVNPQGQSAFPDAGSRDSYYVDDGRTEVYMNLDSDGKVITTDGEVLANTGYIKTQRPDGHVFVFRSYAAPDYDNGMTKLKVLYTNTVKTGTLTIRKEKLPGTDDLKGTYTFNVVFANVAGMGLESEPITMTFTLKQDQQRIITGIPINTEFTITEVPSDRSILEGVTAVEGQYLTFDSEAKEVTGQITPDNKAVKLTFVNMLKPVININVKKTWLNADGGTVEDKDNNLPEYLLIRLQRRVKGSTKEDDWQDVIIKGQETADIKIGNNQERTWEYRFSDLDKYVENEDGTRTDTLWEYRVVEVQEQEDSSGNVTRTVVAGGGIWDNSFQVTYSDPVSGEAGLPPDAKEERESTITNIHTVSLKVKKVDADKKPLGGVTFRLEEYKGTDKNGEAVWETVKISKTNAVTESVTEEDSLTTQSEEENPLGGAGIIVFSNLPRGEYRLIETETAPGHTLLAGPILITISEAGCTYTINETTKNITIKNNTIELEIMNGQNLTMPATGGAGPVPFTVGGLSICMIAGLMYIDSMRKRRKEGKAS